MLSVTYKTKKVKSIDIHKAVAKVGHDTDIERANDKVYDALHGCCHYTRPEKKKWTKVRGRWSLVPGQGTPDPGPRTIYIYLKISAMSWIASLLVSMGIFFL